MKKFIFKFILFSAIIILGITLLLYNFGGRIDYFYEKFTSPKKSSMIIGDSRALQGIVPQVFNDEPVKNWDAPIYNFAFTIKQVPFGEPYTFSIKKKLNSSVKRGLFLVCVDPIMFSENKNIENKKNIYEEKEMPPHNMNFVTASPNYEYFIKNYYMFDFQNFYKKKFFMHKDGWLEVFPNTNSAVLSDNNKNQIIFYQKLTKKLRFSSQRFSDFSQMIYFLKTKGNVFLIRMPIAKSIFAIEQNWCPDFSKNMGKYAVENNLKFFDFAPSEKYKFLDGHHLDKPSSFEFTKELKDSVKIHLK